jgi:hypothetical protein
MSNPFEDRFIAKEDIDFGGAILQRGGKTVVHEAQIPVLEKLVLQERHCIKKQTRHQKNRHQPSGGRSPAQHRNNTGDKKRQYHGDENLSDRRGREISGSLD